MLVWRDDILERTNYLEFEGKSDIGYNDKFRDTPEFNFVAKEVG